MDEEKEQTNENQENQNGISAPEDLEAIKAQLEEEQKAKAELQEALTSKDARIAELQTELSEAKQSIEAETAKLQAATAELAGTKEAKDQAVAKYLETARAMHPSVPQGIISGATIEEIDQSVEKGKALVESVKRTLEAEAAQTKVPAGAPTRGAISLEGLSPREKIAAGIMSLRGTQ